MIQSVSVFRPESISKERSRRETAAKFHHFSARVFFEITPLCQNSRIYVILRFSWMLTLRISEKCWGDNAFARVLIPLTRLLAELSDSGATGSRSRVGVT